jgi:hypothetical protein
LQHHQQLETAVGVEQVLQRVQFCGQGLDGLFVGCLVAGGERLGRGVEVAQLKTLALRRATERESAGITLGACAGLGSIDVYVNRGECSLSLRPLGV